MFARLSKVSSVYPLSWDRLRFFEEEAKAVQKKVLFVSKLIFQIIVQVKSKFLD